MSPLAILNGELLPESEARISILDRGFLYGDGIFETVRFQDVQPLFWSEHMNRLAGGADALRLSLPRPPGELRTLAERLFSANGTRNGLVRLVVSRGAGPRGYSPKGANQPTLVMTLHQLPGEGEGRLAPARLVTSSVRLPIGGTLELYKTCCKLPNVLARAEADTSGADEALLPNTDRKLVSASSANLFWISGGAVLTAPVGSGILPGVTRQAVIALCARLEVEVREALADGDQLSKAEGVFLTSTGIGLRECCSLDGGELRRSTLFKELAQEWQRLQPCVPVGPGQA